MTRAEHLSWSKQRALQYVDAGDLSQAFASMGSDLETEGHSGIRLGAMLLLGGHPNTSKQMRDFVEGFN